MLYELRQYDTTLLTFNVERKELDNFVFDIVRINDKYKYLLPIGMTEDSDGLFKWLKSRVIPKNREFVDQILAKSGLARNDVMGIINVCKGLSLNDSYWVVEQGFEGKFENYNLYQNKFATTLALIAYTGYGSNGKRGFTSSPEFTTNGALKKCWRRRGGGIYLYKGGSSGGVNTGNEPYSEFYASQIAEVMGLNHVSYGLSKWKGQLCSTCELFTDINTSFVPVYKFDCGTTLSEIAAFLKSLGDEFYNSFADMMIFDSLICNVDRHGGNYGLLVNKKTNKPIKFAPVFDNGLSLFCSAIPDDFDSLDEYAKTRYPAYDNVTFEDVAKAFISERQKAELRRLINFRFKRHSRYNLPKERLSAIEKFLQKRIREFLNY